MEQQLANVSAVRLYRFRSDLSIAQLNRMARESACGLKNHHAPIRERHASMSAMGQKLTSGSPSQMSARRHEPTFALTLSGNHSALTRDTSPRHVRFTPDSRHSSVQVGCPRCAKSGHMQCSKIIRQAGAGYRGVAGREARSRGPPPCYCCSSPGRERRTGP